MNWQKENKLKQEAQYYEKEFSYNQVYIMQGYSNTYNNFINEFIERLKGNTGRGLITNWDKSYGISYEKLMK